MTVQIKEKPCKGIGKAKGFGCGSIETRRTYGLGHSCGCYAKWLYSTEEGKSIIRKSTLRAKNDVIKKKKRELASAKRKLKKFEFYKTTAWKYCSRFVLLYYADEDGYVSCCTSPELIYHVTDKRIHCGHFIKMNDSGSTNYSVAFDFRNLAPQSYRDNVKLGGKPEEMEKWIIEMHGKDALDDLMKTKRFPLKLDKHKLDEFTETYKKLFRDLLVERGINNPWKN